MAELRSPDGRFLFAIQGDTNEVLYDTSTTPWSVLFSRWTYEAHDESRVDPPPPVPGRPDAPTAPPRTEPRVIRVTDEQDGALVNRQYSYWSNAWVREGVAYVFAGNRDGTPRLFAVTLASGRIERLPWLLPYRGETEGWYWSAAGAIYLLDGPRLRRVNPFNPREDDVVIDISDNPGCDLWQAHSSDDGETHSATVRRMVQDGPYQPIGTLVYWQGHYDLFPARGVLDESQITPDGGYLVIKEDNDNRIITLGTRETRVLRDADGAVGHSDCGPGLLVGEDDQHGACVLWDLQKPLTPGNRVELFKTWNMGHLSIRWGLCLLSDATHLSLVALDGSGVTPLVEHGMQSDGTYDTQVFANLDPTGTVACYMSNVAGRLDVYLLVL